MTKRFHAAIVLAACILVVLPAAAGRDLPAVADRLFEGLQKGRAAAGVPGLVRRPDLDAVALERAHRIAELPTDLRFSVPDPVEDAMRVAKIERFRRVVEHVDLWRGGPDPSEPFLMSWKRYRQAWKSATSGVFDSVGLGAYWADDGWHVLVAVLVEEVVPPPPAEIRKLERATLKAVNRARKENGSGSLRPNPALADVARAHSEDMIRRGYFDHRTPAGLEPADRVVAAGLLSVKLGENIHKNGLADDPVGFAVRSWLGSPGHREIMLDPDFRETGIGVAVDDEGTIHFTQLFRLPHDDR